MKPTFEEKYMPPIDIIQAAESVRRWAESRGHKTWMIAGCYSAPSPPLVAVSDTAKPRKEFLDLAQTLGARLTGKPDGSEPIEIIFTVDAWRKFDAALAGQVAPQATVEPLTAFPQLSPTEAFIGTIEGNVQCHTMTDVYGRTFYVATPPTNKATDHCRVCGEAEPLTGSCGSSDPAALCNLATSKADTGGQIRNADVTFGFNTKVPSLKKTIVCNKCDGSGRLIFGEHTEEDGTTIYHYESCDRCNGTGNTTTEPQGAPK
jgi:hypothetical protein